MPGIDNYSDLSDDQLADIVETLGRAQATDTRGVLLLEAASRLRSRPEAPERR